MAWYVILDVIYIESISFNEPQFHRHASSSIFQDESAESRRNFQLPIELPHVPMIKMQSAVPVEPSKKPETVVPT